MSFEPIRLRDSPDAVQQRLSINRREFENLKVCPSVFSEPNGLMHWKSYARQAHREFCRDNPDSHWADIDEPWSSIPEKEKRHVLARLHELCSSAGLFAQETGLVTSAYEQRLNLARSAWLQERRKKRSQLSRSFDE